MKILILDDSQDILDVLELLLTEKFQVKTTLNYEVVLRNALECDLLITDLDMPQMNGVEVIKEVQKRRSDLPIILFTALDKELVHTLPLKGIKNLYFAGDKDMNQLMTLVEKVYATF